MGLEPLSGQMAVPTQGISLTIIFRVKVFINGPMAVSLQGNGKITKWMVRETLVGKMGGINNY